eukprot:TRINITY_DN8812_c0_g1_i1.p1 TRINITY_DN8812_c0_g1~~TRINITY_DN8812_c0_g1_i1.p1  ORF type:complete len:193 (+),score=83.09 TRINITY_DN8812_c0_g1_i1:55-633(+)
MKFFLLFLFINFISFSICIKVESKFPCSNPDPAPGFKLENYEGIWYEIAKIQTSGGAFFERNCVCTYLNVTEVGTGKVRADVDNVCRNKSPTGETIIASAQLINENPPGKFQETFGPGLPTVSYTIITLEQEYSVEYDCGESNFATNYCVHFMSRKPTLNSTILNQLIAQAEDLGLNPLNLPVKYTLQDGCW